MSTPYDNHMTLLSMSTPYTIDHMTLLSIYEYTYTIAYDNHMTLLSVHEHMLYTIAHDNHMILQITFYLLTKTLHYST